MRGSSKGKTGRGLAARGWESIDRTLNPDFRQRQDGSLATARAPVRTTQSTPRPSPRSLGKNRSLED